MTDKEIVNSYLAKLKHPLKNEIEAVRKIIKSSDKSIKERIKWNAPSYHCSEDLVTFNHRNLMAVHLVFHHPGIVKIKSPLLLGDYKDRRMTYFKNMKEVKTQKAELQAIIRQLVKLANKNSLQKIKRKT